MYQYLYDSPDGKWSIYYHSPSQMAYELFSYIDNVGFYECSPQYVVEREGYFSYMILLTRDGEGSLEYKNKTYTLDSNHVAFINCFEWHKYYPSDENTAWNLAWVHFDGQVVDKYLKYVHEASGPVIYIENPQLILERIEKIFTMIQKNPKNLEFNINSQLTHMLNILLLNSQKTNDSSENIKQEEIIKAIDYLKSNYMYDLNVADIARTVNLSKSHFSRLFKQYTGYSPYEYLIKYRLIVSKHELCHTNKTISQIAEDVGFTNTNNYISTFKRYEKITPKQYRKNNQLKA